MTDVPEVLKKQAEWQKRRRNLSWPEKVRFAEAVRDSVESLRRTAPGPPPLAAAHQFAGPFTTAPARA